MTVLEDESDDNLVEALVDSDKAGQETAPITGPASTTPLEGRFQAGLLGRPALPSLVSVLSAPAKLELSSGGDEEAAFGEESENGGWSGTEVVSDDDEEEDDGGDGDGWMPEFNSGSPPRTTWAHGDGRFFRGNLGLLTSPALVGEWWLEEESVAVTIANLGFLVLYRTDTAEINQYIAENIK